MYAPLKWGTNEPARDYDYVDHLSLLGEEEYILDSINRSENQLRKLNGLCEIKM